MKNIHIKNSLIALLLGIIIFLLALNQCQKNKTQKVQKQNQLLSDDISQAIEFKTQASSVLFGYLEQSKKERLALIKDYQQKIEQLETKSITLKNLSQSSKAKMLVFRKQADTLKWQLQASILNISNSIANPDTLNQIILSENISENRKESITKNSLPILEQFKTFTILRDSSDRLCDTTIALLEQGIIKKDSIIFLHRNVENQLRDLSKEQLLKEQYLTNQLNTAYKVQRSKTRQNKILKGGLLILSGIITSILLIQNSK
jgi:hypothetical protein